MMSEKAPWQSVARFSRLLPGYRGRDTSARLLYLDCGHEVRVTGKKAITAPERMRCHECLERVR